MISVVDDDEALRESLAGLLKSIGYCVEVFSSAENFLGSAALATSSCLILDVRMPGMSGPELQQVLLKGSRRIPVIFITAHGDDDIISRVMADGAIDCLIKPFGEEPIIKGVNRALAG